MTGSGTRIVVTNPAHRAKLSDTSTCREGKIDVVTVGSVDDRGG